MANVDDSVYTPVEQNFVRSCSILLRFRDNAFLRFTQKFNMATKTVGRMSFGKKFVRDCVYLEGQKFCQNRFNSHRLQDQCSFVFYANFRRPLNMARKRFLARKWQVTLLMSWG